MKKRTWIYLALIAACLVAFLGYRMAASVREDSQAPQILVDTQLLQLSVQAPTEELLQGISAQDDRDGDVTESVVVESIRLADGDGTAVVTYAAFDRAGNVTKLERKVQYTDYQSPRFHLDAPLLFTQNSGVDVLDQIRATDLWEGDISRRIRATTVTEASIAELGDHQVEFRVTNSMGDTVKLVLPVEVYAAGTYQGTLKLTDYLIYLPVGSEFDAEDYLDRFILSKEEPDLSAGLPKTMSLKISGEPDLQTPGVYSVDFTVTYRAGDASAENRGYSGYSRLIIVVEE